MENEDVEFNEVRCKTLILGDEETGFINLKVSKIDDSPAIEINPNEGDEDSSIIIGFKDGRPILNLITNKTNEKRHIITLHFDEGGMPIMEMGTQYAENKYENLIGLGLSHEGTPVLILSSEVDQDTFVAAGLIITEDGQASLVLRHENVKGGNIVIRVDDDGGGIIMETNEDSTDQTDSTKLSKGILLVNNSKVTLMDIKGQTIGSKNKQEEKSSSEGESNE